MEKVALHVYEMSLKVFLIKDISFDNAREAICKLIDKSLLKETNMKEFHEENKFKMYTFNSFYPLEKDRIYKAGNIYTIVIRTIDENLVKYFKTYLVNEYTEEIKALTIQHRIIPKRVIEKIYTISPAIIKCENGYWKNNITVDQYEKQLNTNLIKKFNAFFDTKINEDFQLFTFIKFDNKYPIPCKYKNIKLLGDKFTLSIDSSKEAQQLAYLALGAGIAEMGARGYGFCNFKWI